MRAMRLISTLVILVAAAVAQFAHADSFGNETVGGSTQSGVRRIQIATQVTMPEDGTVTSITAYVGGKNQPVKYAIYSDNGGEPDVLLGETAAANSSNSMGWVTIDLASPASINAGTYWLALSMKHSQQKYAYQSGSGQTRYNGNNAVVNSYSATWGSSTSSLSREISIYATYSASSGCSDIFERRVNDDDDDAEEDGGVVLDHDKMELGQQPWLGVRFTDIQLPQGATIARAYVRFKAADSNTESTDLTIFGADADSAATIVESEGDLSSRPRTAASKTWSNVSNWSMNQFYDSPDITSIIQEIVDRSGWSSGNAMLILFRSDDENGKRLVVAHDDQPSNAPLLHIEYCGGVYSDVSAIVGFDVQSTSDKTYGSGWHWGDLDDDGDLDAIATGNTARLYLSSSEGAGFFVSSLGDARRQGALLDIDDDDDLDFWVAGRGSYDVEGYFDNDGSASLSWIGHAGFDNPSNSEGVAAADVDADGVADVIHFSENGNWIGDVAPGAPPTIAGSADAALGLNDLGDTGNGDYCSSADINHDGLPDFFYHYGGGKLFLSNGDGTYTESASGISVQTGNSDKMGSTWGDYDNDGDLDLFVPRFDTGNTGYLFRNDSGAFVNVTMSAGLDDSSGQRSASWGDYDNDGDLDLYVVTHSGAANVLYSNNDDGTFTAVAENAEAAGDGHDGVFIDYDNDGDLDISVSQEDAGNTLLRNSTNDASYLKVRVLGAGRGGTNSAAIGVRVELLEADGTTFVARRDVGVARGYGGIEPLWLHFGGVDPAATYVVRTHFLSGVIDTPVVPQNVTTTIAATTIDQMLTIQEPDVGLRLIRWVEVDPDR